MTLLPQYLLYRDEASVAQWQSGGFVISSLKCRSIVSHIIWHSAPNLETTIGVRVV